MLASRIPALVAQKPPASIEQIDRLAATLGLELPDDYRALLSEANGVSANLVEIFPAEDVPELAGTYEVAEYAPGYILIGSVNSFPVLLRAGKSSVVYENDWGAMTPDIMDELAPSLADWIERGCPDRNGRTAADSPNTALDRAKTVRVIRTLVVGPGQ